MMSEQVDDNKYPGAYKVGTKILAIT